ncbi:trafficking protein particle complex subunit 6b [Anaeramoeba ignava]|uniref:Trafficking protein particle complex subunit 6b n=1 Tax=Anaeramoeba ignava TaxID=1746090 RepID=A0A9Q0R6T0_ANAIG|nr:trafficking protein particle complex subunit 6b [Anaeramoeba ignava]
MSVSESIWSLLLNEFVNYVVSSVSEPSEPTKEENNEDFINDPEDQKKITKAKLSNAGYQIGQKLADRYTKDRSRFREQVDIIRFLCKDFWTLLFGKNVDNLKTNHRGMWIIRDENFRPLRNLSFPFDGKNLKKFDLNENQIQIVQRFLYFPCGLIRGALSALGIDADVDVHCSLIPACEFTVISKESN